jgi:hypothetical protein
MKLMMVEIEKQFTERGRQENIEDPLVIVHLFNPVGRGDR